MGYKAVRLLTETIIVIITIFIACFSLYASQSRLFNPQTHVFASLIGLFAIIFIVINLFLSFYWASKLRAWFFVSIATLLLFIPYFLTMFQISFESPPAYKDRDICIATYNVKSFAYHGHYTENFKNIAFALAEKDPDVICFQEIWFDKKLSIDSITKFLEMPYYSIGKNGVGVKDLAIFSKYPIIKTKSQIYPNTHNGSMYCDVKIKDKTIRIINAHLQTSNFNQSKQEVEKLKQVFKPRIFAKAIQTIYITISENSKKRAQQALEINKIIKECPYSIFVCGDMNETPSSFVYEKVKDNLTDGFRQGGRGFGSTYRKLFGILRLDYIFNSKDYQCINYFSEKLPYSDHKPVFGFYKRK
ncbi:MAG: Endonuclease/Exonuclease/phosphatase family protein [Bacteroidetes bacterium]|nr:Endonuclease/Exonuclease/phosphatase family protein [Bacteroidota bacterium]